MKKICFLTALLIILLVFAGCKNANGQTFGEYIDGRYPFIYYHNSYLNFDNKNREIELPDGYTLNQGNSYEWVETEEGCDLIIHFVKGGN